VTVQQNSATVTVLAKCLGIVEVSVVLSVWMRFIMDMSCFVGITCFSGSSVGLCEYECKKSSKTLKFSRKRASFRVVPRFLMVKSDDTLYEDDPYGGWKGTRKSSQTEAWKSKGNFLEIDSNSSIFTISTQPTKVQSSNSNVLLIPGFPSTSFSFRNILNSNSLTKSTPILSQKHFFSSFDWLGTGLSSLSQHKIARTTQLEHVILNSTSYSKSQSTVTLVAQGFLACESALEVILNTEFNASIKRLILLSPPINNHSSSSKANDKLPSHLQKLLNPLLGPILLSNPAYLVDKLYASSGPYEIKETDLEVIREPYLSDGNAGFTARDLVRECYGSNTRLNSLLDAFITLKSSNSQETPEISIVFGAQDKWIPIPSTVQYIEQKYPSIPISILQNTGHFIQEDYPQLLLDLLD